MNIHKDQLSKLTEKLPSFQSPTVSPLLDSGAPFNPSQHTLYDLFYGSSCANNDEGDLNTPDPSQHTYRERYSVAHLSSSTTSS
eukprot:627250-Prorocentrum_minimum.AAC.2